MFLLARTIGRSPASVCLLALLCASGYGASAPESSSRERSPAAERRYREGVKFYSDGSKSQALACFKEALSLAPRDPAVGSAVRRVEIELAQSIVAAPPPAAGRVRGPKDGEERFSDHLLEELPRRLRFERTLGDAWSAQGTLEAMQGRVAQLLSERKVARARGQAYAKEHELRAIVRRLPLTELI